MHVILTSQNIFIINMFYKLYFVEQNYYLMHTYNSGNYNYNYAQSFFRKDFFKFKYKRDQEGEKTHISVKTAGL